MNTVKFISSAVHVCVIPILITRFLNTIVIFLKLKFTLTNNKQLNKSASIVVLTVEGLLSSVKMVCIGATVRNSKELTEAMDTILAGF